MVWLRPRKGLVLAMGETSGGGGGGPRCDLAGPRGPSAAQAPPWRRSGARPPGFALAGLLVLAAAIFAAGCDTTVPSPEDRAVVEEAVTRYLHALADAYSSLSVEPLEEVATQNEIEEIRRTLRGLAGSGNRVEARLLSVDFVSVSVFREVNATVTTTEVWEVTRFEAFTGRQTGQNPTSIQDSIIQLRLVDGGWRVSARRVAGQEVGPKWKVETPAPSGRAS